jgi:hypothetical protein
LVPARKSAGFAPKLAERQKRLSCTDLLFDDVVSSSLRRYPGPKVRSHQKNGKLKEFEDARKAGASRQ